MVVAGFLSFFVSTAAWQAAAEKNDFWVGKIFLELNSGGCWIPFFFCVYSCLAGCPGKKMIFGSGKSFFWNWTVVIAGFLSFFCVYSCLAGCPGKK